MKKLLLPIAALILALTLCVPVFADATVTTSAAMIMGGGNVGTEIGTLNVAYYEGATPEDSYFEVTVELTHENAVSTDETHIYLDTTEPQKHSPGKFPYASGEPIYLDVNEGDTVYIAAHAQLTWDTGLTEIIDEVEVPIYVEESAWAQIDGTNIPIGKGRNWATYFEWNSFGLPDLVVSSIDILTPNVSPEDEIAISYTVSNIGEEGPTGISTFDVLPYLSTDQVLDETDIELSWHYSVWSYHLAEGWSQSETISAPLYDTVPDGDYYIIVLADALPGMPPNYYPGVNESNEDNNWAVSSTTVSIQSLD
jgi:hypothetical protein